MRDQLRSLDLIVQSFLRSPLAPFSKRSKQAESEPCKMKIKVPPSSFVPQEFPEVGEFPPLRPFLGKRSRGKSFPQIRHQSFHFFKSTVKVQMSNIAKGLWKDGISVAEGNFLVGTDGADRSSPALFVSFLWFLLSRQACALLKGQPCLLLRGQRWCCLFLQLLTRVGEGTVVVQEVKRSRTRCGALTGVCTLSYQRLN